MTIDVPFVDVDSLEGNIPSYSIVQSDSLASKLKLKVSKNNKVPSIVLKKKDDNEFIVETRRTPKIKKFDDYETNKKKAENAVSPRKRRPSKVDLEHESPTKKAINEICQSMNDDFKLKSPLKVHLARSKDIEDMNLRRTPSRAAKEQTPRSVRLPRAAKQNLNFAENDFIDGLCASIDTITVATPKKRNASKAAHYDSQDDIHISPRKRAIINGSFSVTPKRRGRSNNAETTPPKQQNEDEGSLSEKLQSRTPSRYDQRDRSPLKSAKKNLDESFRTQLLKKNGVLKESTSNRWCKPESFVQIFDDIDDDSPKKRRSTRIRSISMSSDISEKCDNQDSREKSVKPRRRLLSKSSSSSDDSDYIIDVENTPKSPKSPRKRKTVNQKMTEDLHNSDYVPKTPSRRKTMSRKVTEDIVESEYVPKTPKTPSRRRTQVGTSKIGTPKTPRDRLKLIRDGVLTPTMQSRKSRVPANTTPLMQARNQLHVSYVPSDLPCREKEYLNVFNFLKGKLSDGCGGCMYVSGVPGTGKTATVTSVIDRLQNTKGVPKFDYVSVNGMRLTEPKQAYVEIWKQLTGKTRPWEQAQSLLEERFTKKGKLSPVIMLIDELDILCTKRQDVVYNLLDWPSKCKDQLIVITIANTMDLPERLLMNKVTSRLGLTRLTFQPYNHKQLMEIVTKRLTGTDSFNPDAVQLVARKVASVSGDARRALDICRRATEIAEDEGKSQLVSIAHVDRALNAMITQPKVMAMKRCSRLEKLILQAVVAEVERTGVEETTFADMFKMLVSCCALDGFKMVAGTVAQRAVCQLSSCRLILTDQKSSDIFQKIILNVSVDEVYFALKS